MSCTGYDGGACTFAPEVSDSKVIEIRLAGADRERENKVVYVTDNMGRRIKELTDRQISTHYITKYSGESIELFIHMIPNRNFHTLEQIEIWTVPERFC